MSPARGEVIAGRFELRGDPQSAIDARLGASRIRGARSLRGWDHSLWVPGVDRQSGAEIRYQPRQLAFAWASDVELVTAARRVLALGLPSTVQVLHAGPGIVFAAPPPASERPRLPIEQAAACAIDACEVAARLHAEGIDEHLAFDPLHLRVFQEHGQWHLRWLVPGTRDVAFLGPEIHVEERDEERLLAPVRRTVRELAQLFVSLCPDAGSAEKVAAPHADVASFARHLLTLAPARADLPPRVAAMPVVQELPPLRHEWDWIIEDGEAQLPQAGHFRKYIELPLAAAYHQRGCRSFAKGDLDAALRDADRALALDAILPHRTTRAVLLDALGRKEESRREIALAADAVLAAEKALSEVKDDPAEWLESMISGASVSEADKARARRLALRLGLRGDVPADEEIARAHVVRALFALRDGVPDTAEPLLRRAMDLAPTPLAERLLRRFPGA